jgi:hypothetical protein
MSLVEMSKERLDERAEYRERMLVNVLAASFLTLLIISGYWIVTTLTGGGLARLAPWAARVVTK